MKKVRTILLVLLAMFFFSKNMLSYANHPSKVIVYAIDLEEKESPEKTDKDPLDGKEKNEEWIISAFHGETRHTVSAFSFLYYKESSFISPYFEICPRPPQQRLFS